MQRTKLIWFDMTLTTRHAEADQNFQDNFDIQYCSNPNCLDEEVELEPGAAFCFEFDYPDRPGMSLLCSTKEHYPQIPILMITTQHSESLAVWAYRNRVLDFLVNPVMKKDILRCTELLQAIQTTENRQNTRSIIDYRSVIPMEVPSGQRTGNVRLATALHFVQRNFRRKIRSAEVAGLCGMSSSHFSRAFAETFSLTFQEFVLRYRIFEACKELQHPNVSVANVAESVGFNDSSYFARVFRRFVGLTPSSFCERIGLGDFDQRMERLAESLQLPELEPTRITHEKVYFGKNSQIANSRG